MQAQQMARWGRILALFTLWTSATFARKLNTPAANLTSSQTPPDATAANPVTAGLPKLIPLQLLLGNSKYRNPQLSPNGKYLAYVKPSGDGVINVFIKQLPTAVTSLKLKRDVSLFDQEGIAADKQVTFDSRRGISTYSWSDGGDAILYIQDKDGDENDHL
jgi:dipeptidyl aminopeptidase/acylaminoacyl peptidase